MARHKGGNTSDRDHHHRIRRDLWTQRDQDQNDDRLPHCCGVCQDSPGGDQGQGML
jgi:hypothetical protein